MPQLASAPDPVGPPEHLQPATAEWWEATCTAYVLEPHHVRLLTLAAEAWDRGQEARQILAADGITVTDRFDQVRPHPAVAIERDARLSFARLMRELDLDSEPAPLSRPPRRGSVFNASA